MKSKALKRGRNEGIRETSKGEVDPKVVERVEEQVDRGLE